MRVLKARLYQGMMGKETEQRHTARKQQVGTRSQSERIRTYNFSQDRVTDHRTGYVTRDIKVRNWQCLVFSMNNKKCLCVCLHLSPMSSVKSKLICCD